MTLNKIVAGFLVAVSAVMSADAAYIDWKEDSITYICNGATNCPQKEEYNSLSLPKYLATVKRPGYKFLGWQLKTARCTNGHVWYKISSNTSQILKTTYDDMRHNESDVYVTQNECVKYYYDLSELSEYVTRGHFEASAQWEMINYRVNLYFNGGYVDNTVSLKNVSSGPDWSANYTINDGIVLPRPKRNGYVFRGWCNNEKMTYCENNPDLYDTTQFKTYYAKWEKGDGSSISSGFSGDFKPINNLKPVNSIKIKPIKLNK